MIKEVSISKFRQLLQFIENYHAFVRKWMNTIEMRLNFSYTHCLEQNNTFRTKCAKHTPAIFHTLLNNKKNYPYHTWKVLQKNKQKLVNTTHSFCQPLLFLNLRRRQPERELWVARRESSILRLVLRCQQTCTVVLLRCGDTFCSSTPHLSITSSDEPVVQTTKVKIRSSPQHS